MSDSDWNDPFADDEAARERERRRAEREARRRERSQSARESLGERVREGLDQGPADPQPAAAPPPQPPAATPAGPTPPAAAPPPSPPPRPPAAAAVRRRRTAALVAVGALIVVVAGAGAVLSRRGDDAPVTTTPVKERKTVSIVIPEGFDRTQIAPIAKKAGLRGDYEEATRSFKGFDPAKYGAKDAESLEGFLFPATYEVFKNGKVEDLVAKQLDAFSTNLDSVDLSYAEKQGLSPYDVVIVASMIEREIAVPEERKLAASVIYNRLEQGTPLGIDATIRFEDHNFTEPLVQSRLETDTPYNTRINAGLPPGPIGNPGLASLEAAANPAETDYFFYVIKPGTCNEHAFVETDAEFAAAEAEYQAALQAEGGSPTEC